MNPQTPPTDERPPGESLPPPAAARGRSRAQWGDIPVSRDRHEGKLGGVIAGLSSAFGFDRRLARIVVAVCTIVVPALLLVYIAAWVLLPPDSTRAESLRQLVTDRGRLPLLILLGVAIAFSGIVTSNGVFGVRGVGWGVALIVLGIMLWVVPERNRTLAAPAYERQAAEPGTSSWAPPTTVGAAPPLFVPRTAHRTRRPVGAIALGLTALGVGIAVTGDGLGWWQVNVVGLVVTASFVLAAAAVASAIVNNRFGRIVLVLPLAALAALVATTAPEMRGGFGQRTVVAVAAGNDPARLAAGELTVDATALTSATALEAHVGVGRLHVLVPAGAALVVHSRIGAGHLVVDGVEQADGLRVDHDLTRAGATGAPTVELTVRIGAGEIAIDHAAATGAPR